MSETDSHSDGTVDTNTEDDEILSNEEFTEVIAENTDLTTEEIEEGTKDIQIEPPEQAEVVEDEYDSDVVDAALDEIEDTDTDYTNTELHSIDDGDKQHVTMECTMDISDLDAEDKEVICQLARQFEDSFAELKNKNDDYGFSFLRAGSKLAQSDGTPFESETRSQVFGLLHRIGDKHERLVENVFGDGSMEVSDPPAVTAQEAANYYQLLSFILANPDLAASVGES